MLAGFPDIKISMVVPKGLPGGASNDVELVPTAIPILSTISRLTVPFISRNEWFWKLTGIEIREYVVFTGTTEIPPKVRLAKGAPQGMLVLNEISKGNILAYTSLRWALTSRSLSINSRCERFVVAACSKEIDMLCLIVALVSPEISGKSVVELVTSEP